MQDFAKIICRGTKPFLKAQCSIDVIVVDHKMLDTLEVILYDAIMSKEATRIFLNYCVLVSKLSHEDIDGRIKVAKDALLRRHEMPDYVILREFAVNEACLDFILHHLVLNDYSMETKTISLAVQLQPQDLVDELQGGYDIHELVCEKPEGLVEYAFDPSQKHTAEMAPLVRNDSVTREKGIRLSPQPSQSKILQPTQNAPAPVSPKAGAHAASMHRQKSVRKSSFSIGLSALSSSLQRSLAYVGATVTLDTAHKHYKIDEAAETAEVEDTKLTEQNGTTTAEHSLHRGVASSSADERELSYNNRMAQGHSPHGREHAYNRAIADHAHCLSPTVLSPRQPLSRTPSGHSVHRHSGVHHKTPQVTGLHQFPSSRLLAANRVGTTDSGDDHTGSQELAGVIPEADTEESRKLIAERMISRLTSADAASTSFHTGKQGSTVSSDSRTHGASLSGSMKDADDVTPPSSHQRQQPSQRHTVDFCPAEHKPAGAKHPVSNVTSPITSPRVVLHAHGKADPMNAPAAMALKTRPSGKQAIKSTPPTPSSTPSASVDLGTSSKKHPVMQFFDMVTRRRNSIVPAQ